VPFLITPFLQNIGYVQHRIKEIEFSFSFHRDKLLIKETTAILPEIIIEAGPGFTRTSLTIQYATI
jgi:hypothetical protein